MEILAPVLFMLLVGGVLGYFAGQLFKRAAGMALSIGIIIAVLIILIYSGTFNINLDSINAGIYNLKLVIPKGPGNDLCTAIMPV